MEEYITAAEAARIMGLNSEYAAHLARKAYKEGNKWPCKRGRYWYAPLQEWVKILSPKGKVQRKKRKKIETQDQSQPDKHSKLITAAEAARMFGVSRNWAAELARRSKKIGREWPKKMGRLWMAAPEEWQAVFNSDHLKSWNRNQKK
jgi:hypothetical protein